LLASKSEYSFASGSSFALVDLGETVSAWVNTGSGFTQLLSASDSTFSTGNAGVAATGNEIRLTKFKTGPLLSPVANMDAALKELSLTDSFERNEDPLSLGGAWAYLGWLFTENGHDSGRVTVSGWGPTLSLTNGAYRTGAMVSDTGSGVAVAATLSAKPSVVNRSFSLWLDMSTPASEYRGGYELRFTETASGIYTVEMRRWVNGAKTTLASKTGYSFPVGGQFALVDKGGTVSAWTKTGSEYTQLLSASDTTFNTGYVGIEGLGDLIRINGYRSGVLPPF
jgi:hypothetical protein